jgi:hypothetical protein
VKREEAIKDLRAVGELFATISVATWTQAGSTQRRDLYLRANGDVWSWYLTLTRQPVR